MLIFWEETEEAYYKYNNNDYDNDCVLRFVV